MAVKRGKSWQQSFEQFMHVWVETLGLSVDKFPGKDGQVRRDSCRSIYLFYLDLCNTVGNDHEVKMARICEQSSEFCFAITYIYLNVDEMIQRKYYAFTL